MKLLIQFIILNVVLILFQESSFADIPYTRVVSSTPTELLLELNFPSPQFLANQSAGATDVVLQGASVLLQKGAPSLPFVSVPVEIDAHGAWKAEVIDSVFTDQGNILVTPSRGNLKRNQDINSVPYLYSSVYNSAAFFPSSVISSTDPYIMRSERGMAIKVMAATYHPVSRMLRTYQRLLVRVSKVSAQGVNPLPAFTAQLPSSLEWNQILRHHFINDHQSFKYNQTSEDGSMLIICHTDTDFLQAMQPFVRWKTERGMKVQMITYAQAGNSAAAMKAYIQNTFPQEGWSYILLVGDAPQVPPAYIASGPSDQWFGDVAGNDHYTDIMVGRFSANNPAELATQVRRSIWYEKEITSSAGYLANAIGIGSSEGPGDDGEMDWQHQRGILTQLTAFTYNNGFELYDGSQGGNDAAGDPVAADLGALVNDGLGIINYTGHGGSTSFVTSGFSNAEVNGLGNVGKLPFIYSVACVNGEFQSGTCFAEAWLRAESNGQPVGAVATFMSTINQSWNPPMEGQDEMNAILSESISGNIKRTFSGIAVNGCLKMNDSYGSAGTEMTDTWTVFGDPSLLIRTDVPTPMQVNHPPSVPVGTTQIIVNVNADSAMVALSQNGVLIDAAMVISGQVSLSFSPVVSTDSLLVTVTGFNKITYQGMIAVTPAMAAYVVMTADNIQDPSGNNNMLADYDETIDVILQLSNLGLLDAQNITVQVQSNDSLILNLSPATLNVTQLVAGAQVSLPSIQCQTAAFVPDGHQAQFDVLISDGVQTLTQHFFVMLHAPVLETFGFSVNDTAGGNGNGRLDAGESAGVIIQVVNSGSAVSPLSSLTLTSLHPGVSVLNPVEYPGVIAPGSQQVTFQLQVGGSDTGFYQANFDLSLLAGAYQHHSPRMADVNMKVEDFESNDFLSWDWSQQGNAPWFTTSLQPFEGTYCSQSGDIGDSQSSSLVIAMNVASDDSISFARRVSSEQDWDFLQFFMDNNQLANWSGSLGWERFSFPVSAGQHSFRWTYVKDSYLSDGSDCGWIDEIQWPPFINIQDTSSTSLQEGITGAISGLSIFPNPAADFIHVSFITKSRGLVSAHFLDGAGRVVRESLPPGELPAGRQNLLLSPSGLASGIYFLRVNSPDGTFSKRVIVKK